MKRRFLLAILGLLLAAMLTGPGGATAQSSTTFAFPSNGSTVVASGGFIDATQAGYFWTIERGHQVSESFSGPSEVDRAILRIEVPDNVLSPDEAVEWDLEINGTVVGSFTVPQGFTGPLTLDVSFPPISGPTYSVTIRVTNVVPMGAGSHSLAYAGNFAHSIELFAAVPTAKDQCKNGGWRNYGDRFKNQGSCVSFVASGGKRKS